MAVFALLSLLTPRKKREAQRQAFLANLDKARADAEQRRAAHRDERLAKGLSDQAGTGNPVAEILIHGLPRPELRGLEKPGKLKAIIGAIAQAKLERDADVLAGLPLGHSRIGGLPDLPAGQAWPMHGGKKIPFVAQLNLAEFPAAAHGLLPNDGHLFVFALVSNDEGLYPPPTAVFLHRGPASDFVRVPRPTDKEIWPDWQGERVYEVFVATTAPPGRNPTVRSSQFGETLGWLFGVMEGIYGTPGEIADARFEDGDDWINLLAVESEGSMQWSDAGHLYLLVRRSALAKLDFTHVLAAACST